MRHFAPYLLEMRRQWLRILLLLLPFLFLALQAVRVLPHASVAYLDNLYGDARLRLAMPQTQSADVVIVDVDEPSLAEFGRWPWSRQKMLQLVDAIFEVQQARVLGIDMVLAEPDTSSGLQVLEGLARGELSQQPEFVARVASLRDRLDYDAQFAQALRRYPIALGYYFTSDRNGEKNGQLPAPVLQRQAQTIDSAQAHWWTGYGANLPLFTQAARGAGFFNSLNSTGGVVRSMPLLAEFGGAYYESLPLAMLRLASDQPQLALAAGGLGGARLDLRFANGMTRSLPLDAELGADVPFRGAGGAKGGSFAYYSAQDILQGRVPEGGFKDKMVLLGTTAPGLLDLRTTPVGNAYPGVEVHANVLAGLLEGALPIRPDYAAAYELVQLCFLALMLLLILPFLSVLRSVLLCAMLWLGLLGLNAWLYLSAHLVLPVVSAWLLIASMLAIHLLYSYFLANRSKRDLAKLFGSYVPSELVDEMFKDPKHYSMLARNQELTVMFCDLKGFTKMAEGADPLQVQALLNRVFGHLTEIIRKHGGTIDKYMGDCVMAFWGAPLAMPEHAQEALRCALDITVALPTINADLQTAGLLPAAQPPLGVSISLNTDVMCVGNMGTELRQAYTVIGDGVNLAARLEPLSRIYAVDIIGSQALMERNQDWAWQELDMVQVKGRQSPERIFTPVALRTDLSESKRQELQLWGQFLQAYRAGQIEQSEALIFNLVRLRPKSALYALYMERLHLLRHDPPSNWQGITLMGPSKYSPLV